MAWVMLWPWHNSVILRALIWIVIVLLGVVASTATEQDLRIHDPPCVVIDELIGMWTITVVIPKLWAIPVLVAVAFTVFRLVDIFKLPPLNALSRAPRGWGIMLDDLGASAYTCGVLQLILVTGKW